MKKLRILILSLIISVPFAVKAQSEADALRYSILNFGGTARFSAMAGAFGAVGADFSTISTNPAGLGVYRKSEFTFTPSIFTKSSNATYNGQSESDINSNFNISNLGVVFTHKTNNNDAWKYVNFAVGLNSSDNFNNNTTIEGNNQTSSLMSLYCNKAQGNSIDNLDPFSTQLAFNTGLIDTISANNYFSNVPIGNLLQRKVIEQSGSIKVLDFAIGANYNNKLFIGGTIEKSFITFNEQSTYTEKNGLIAPPDFSSFTLNENLNTSGSGINFKFGLIYVPIDIDIIKVKIGAAVHSPTYYTMHDDWSSSMTSNFINENPNSANSPSGSFDYTLTTPMRTIGSLALQIGKIATLSADYEYVNYSQAHLDSKTYKYFDENDSIQNNLTAASNIKIGAEVALGLFSLRCGYAIYGSPYTSSAINGKRTSISGGCGIIDKKYFLDFAYVYSKSNVDYYLYDYPNMNAASVKNNSGNFLLTLGFKF